MAIDPGTSTPADAESLPPAPTPDTPQMDEAAAGAWRNRIKASEQVVTDLKEDWQENVRAYMNRRLKDRPKDHTSNVPLEFSYVELKKAQLAFQVPEVHLKPKLPGLEAALPIFQAAVNHELGAENANVITTIDECLTDVLLCCIAGSKIGYSADIRTRQVPVLEPVIDPMTGGPQMDPQTQQPAMQPALTPVTTPDGMMQFDPATGQPMMQPAMRTEDYVAHEEYFWDRFPAEHLLLPVDFEDSDFDKASWLGMKFRLDRSVAIKRYNLPPDFKGTVSQPRETLSSEEGPARQTTSLEQVEGFEIWYKTAVFEPDTDALPEQYSKVVFIEGHNQPVEHMRSPYQWIGEDGKLHGMEGNPIHPLTLRFLPGSAYPVSDVGISRPISEELNEGRSQMMRFRERAMPMRWVNREGLDLETKEKIARGEIMSTIGVDGNGNELIGVVALPTFPRENFDFAQVAMKDYEMAWSMGRNQTGVTEDESKTATEVRVAQGAADVRLDKERTRVLTWFTRGANKFGSLLQQFKDDAGYAEIAGPDGVKQLQAWNRQQIQGEFAFTAKPDSALRIDQDIERRQRLALYNLLGRDPNVNRVEILKSLVTMHNLDASKIVVESKPEEPKPEPPKLSVAIRGEDMSPLSPQMPIVMALLQQVGVQIPPDAVQNAMLLAQHVQAQQVMAAPVPSGNGSPTRANGAPRAGVQPSPEHPGATPQMEPLSKHQMRDAVGKLN
jgi:hypothetical protein